MRGFTIFFLNLAELMVFFFYSLLTINKAETISEFQTDVLFVKSNCQTFLFISAFQTRFACFSMVYIINNACVFGH